MFYENADADQKPQKVTIEELPGGKRAVRLTDNVQEYRQEEAKDRKMYRFDEVEFTLPASETVTAEEIETEFETWWEYGKTDQRITEPDIPEPGTDTMTRAELSAAVKTLQQDNAALKEQNAMLEECLMEMSEIVYA